MVPIVVDKAGFLDSKSGQHGVFVRDEIGQSSDDKPAAEKDTNTKGCEAGHVTRARY